MPILRELRSATKSNVSGTISPSPSVESNTTSRRPSSAATNASRASSRSAKSNSTGTSSASDRLKQKPSAYPVAVNSKRSCDSLEKNAFVCAYTAACLKYKTPVAPGVKINPGNNSVEVWGDRMRAEDWQAAMEALAAQFGIHGVRIKNRRLCRSVNPLKSYETISSITGAPKTVVASARLFVARLIGTAVNDLLVNSHALAYLELQNVMFDEQTMELLISGVTANQTLQHLSLAYCRIGDGACRSLCRVLRNKPNVRSLNLSGCSLSPAAATGGLVDMIKKQQVRRHEECWAHSLRYRAADPDIMHGLRRLTLNDNTGLGDDGVADLLEALKDDLYVKAVDLQNCGLTDRGGQLALSTLMMNDTLVVLDVRKNGFVSATVLETIMNQLYKNNADKPETSQWKWTKLWREKNAGGDNYNIMSG